MNPTDQRTVPWAIWRDRQGRLSWPRLAAMAAGVLPAFYVLINAMDAAPTGTFSILASMIFYSGVVSIWLVLAALAVTPLRRMTGFGRLIDIRRMLGVSGFAYAALHLVTYVLLREGSLEQMGAELISRVTIIVALVAILMLAALFVTSTDGAVRKMGGDRWARLHRLIYIAAGLAILHYVMSPGSYAGDPFLMMGVYFWLMGWRALQDYWAAATRTLPLLGLAFGAALASLAFEFAALMVFKAMTPDETWSLNYSFEDGPPTPLVVLVVGLLAACIPPVAGRLQARQRPA
jgi:sulfoxide reductase heme-binding subunit YedZ